MTALEPIFHAPRIFPRVHTASEAPVTGAAIVGAALFYAPAVSYRGAHLVRKDHRAWEVKLPGATKTVTLGARQASKLLDAWLETLPPRG